METLRKSREQTETRKSKKSLKCQACNMDSEFVPDGMLACARCKKINYCSPDCMQWHWRHGGHAKACEGNRGAAAAIPEDHEMTHESDQDSIEPFEPQQNQGPHSQGGVMEALRKSREQTSASRTSKKALRCQACNMDSEFVPDGMLDCGRCKEAHYCSRDCLQWHWNSGGHRRECTGISLSERQSSSTAAVEHDADDMSIDAFGTEGQDGIQPPSSSAGVAAALRASQAQTAKPTAPTLDSKCLACGMEEDFVEGGMVGCPHCMKATYCSSECLKWDWSSGGHKDSCKGEQDAKPARKAEAEGHSIEQPTLPVKCHVCQMEEEFVSEGMLNCPNCSEVVYCSDECREWDWKSGGHRESCGAGTATSASSSVAKQSVSSYASSSVAKSYASSSVAKQSIMSSSIMSSVMVTSSNQSALQCNACGMDSEFVPDGMLLCACKKAHYCSSDCKQWHWRIHKNDCSKSGGDERAQQRRAGSPDASDDKSIQAFEEGQAPQDGDTLAAIAASRSHVEKSRLSEKKSVANESASLGQGQPAPAKDARAFGDDQKQEATSRFQTYRESRSLETKAEASESAYFEEKRPAPTREANNFDREETQEVTSRFQSYRGRLVAAVTGVTPWIDAITSSIKTPSVIGNDLELGNAPSVVSSSGSSSSSSNSESTGLGSCRSVDSSDYDKVDVESFPQKLASHLAKNARGGAAQLAAPSDEGNLPTFVDPSKMDTSAPPSTMSVGTSTTKSYKNLHKPSGVVAPMPIPELDSADGSDESQGDIESGVPAGKTEKPSPENEEEVAAALAAAESRKISRRRCILLNAIIILALAGACIGLGVKYWGQSGDDDSAPAPSPTPTDLTPATAGPTTTSPPSLPTSLPPGETQAPTFADPLGSLLGFLVSESFDDGVALGQAGSPQNQAYEWLLSDPGLPVYPPYKILQRFAMATFFYSTGGDFWEENTLWLSPEDECNWFSRAGSSPVCKSDRLVTLELDFNNVEGVIPAELAYLSQLERVELSGGPERFLSGSLPSEVGLLTSLDYFSVRGNQQTGTIPTELGNWKAIRTLNLSLNRFRGLVPSQLGGLTNLREIFLGSNELTGPLPTEFGQASKLFRISVGGNRLSGGLPTEIGQLTELRYIYMETNQFSSLPSEIGLLTSLIVMAMFDNALASALPSEVGGLSELRSLLLTNNSLSTTIPSEIGMLEQLGKFDLDPAHSDCYISGHATHPAFDISSFSFRFR